MRIPFRVLVSLLMTLATLLLVNCGGAPGCNPVTMGSSACAIGQSGFGSGSSGGGGSGGGGGGGGNNATPAAFVYAVDQIGGANGNDTNGTIDGYDLSTSATSFSALNGYSAPTIPASEAGEAMVVVNKKFVYAVFEIAGDIYGWSINSSTGALTPLSGFPLKVTLNLPVGVTGQYQMTTDPGGNFLFISSTGANDIFVYAINGSSGALTAAPGSPFASSSIEPGNIATDGLGRFLYVCVQTTHEGTQGTPGLAGFSIGSNGALTPFPGGLFGQEMWELQADASGRYMIGTTGNSVVFSGSDDDHLYVFSINQTTGVLTPVATSPVATTYSPYTIAMQPPSSNGEFVYTFGYSSANTFNPIEGFQLDPNTGALTKVTGSPFSNIFLGEWAQFDQSGTNLLVYSTTAGGSGTVAEIGALSVSSAGALTQPISPITLVTPGWFVVTDP